MLHFLLIKIAQTLCQLAKWAEDVESTYPIRFSSRIPIWRKYQRSAEIEKAHAVIHAVLYRAQSVLLWKCLIFSRS